MDENQLDGLNKEQGVQEPTNPRVELTDDARAAARRRFLKGAVGVAPVLLTLKSKPVLACYCTSASAAMSGTLKSTVAASHTPRQVPCSGRSPGYWKVTNSLHWPTYKWGKYTTNNGSGLMTPVLQNGIHIGTSGNTPTRFTSVFGGTRFGNKTFLQVLTGNAWGSPSISVSNQQLAFGRALVAGALNIAGGKWPSNLVSLNTLKQMYLQIVEGPGYYTTSAGDKMYIDQAIDYLSNMWE